MRLIFFYYCSLNYKILLSITDSKKTSGTNITKAFHFCLALKYN